jgi:hypothetical protein
VFKYTAPFSVKDRNNPTVEENVLATPTNARQMYMKDPGDREWPPKVYEPPKEKVPKATVIRAIAVDTISGKQSDVKTKTYFIGTNLNKYGNTRVISLVSDPEGLVSENSGILVRGNPSNGWYTNPPYNFRQKGSEWEREAYLEVFDGSASSRSTALSAGVGIRVRGGYSRGQGQKSFNVYFRNRAENLNLIPGAVKADGKTPITTYTSIMLRNGSNDAEYTKYYDVFMQDMLSDRSFTTQAAVPCVVYLNGEYWGPYCFQERYSGDHTEYKYGVNKSNVISWDNGEIEDGSASDMYFIDNFYSFAGKDMSVPANYNAFCDIFDIDNFIDYWAAQIYIYNEDWPHNNYRMWRTRTKEPGNPYGDTKWRYQLFDTEYALGIYSGGELKGNPDDHNYPNAFEQILGERNDPKGNENGTDRNYKNNKLFVALLKNPDFCKQFVNTMLDLYNVNFHSDNYADVPTSKLNTYADLYRTLMTNVPGGYFDRWNGNSWDFDTYTDRARSYLTKMRAKMVSTSDTDHYLQKYFGNGYQGLISSTGVSTSNLRDVTISVQGGSGATIKVNTVSKSITPGGSWTGLKYYSVIPITVEAPQTGFLRWEVTNGTPTTSTDPKTTVTLGTGTVTIRAVYGP